MNGCLHIGVVGCGIAGTSFALLARRSGHEVDLFEQTQHVGPLGAGVLLQPSGQKILADMGLLTQVTEKAELIHEIHAVTHHGHDLVRLSYNDASPNTFAFGLHRGDLFTVLHNALESTGVNLHLGVAINSCTGGTLTDQSSASHGPYDLIVVADGNKSRLRQSSNIPFTSYEYTHGALWAVGQCDAVHNKLWQITHGTRRLCGLLPMGQGRCSLFWGLRRDEYHQLQQSSAWQDWQRQVLKLAPAAAQILASLNPPTGLTFTTFHHITMSRWHTDQMIFIGDAAHATSPHLGQGVNLALIDAATLATAIEQEPTIPAALATYTNQRQKQIRYYSKVTRFLTPFFQSNSRLLGLGRNIFLPRMHHLPPLRRLMLKTLRGEMYLL
jgi:2-polyprenyl-6-methoxyphenol hydroxylase-like FAD-dependent oxidoreductase